MTATAITIDLNRLLPASRVAVVVDQVGDYLGACVELRRALQSPGDGRPPTIRVHDATAAAWLAALAQSYGTSRVEVHYYSARDALGERWSIEVPPTVREAEILASRLLDEQVTARTGQSFEDALLEHFYGGAFAYPRFPIQHLAVLLNDYDRDKWDENARRGVVQRVYRTRLRLWAERENSDARRELISRLESDPAQLRADLAAFKLLRRSPSELVDRVLGDQADLFRRAAVDVDILSLAGVDLTAVQTEIGYYLNSAVIGIKDADDVSALLSTLSGTLLVEFDAVESLLQENPELVTADLLRQVERAFAPLRDAVGSRLASLRLLIAPEYPAHPEPTWSVDAWLNWVRHSYMPYYRWLEARRGYDQQVADYAAMFADWYYEHFVELRNAVQDRFAFAALYLDRERIVDRDAVTFVLLIDNFNYVHFDELRRLFNRHGLSLVADQPVLSLIPTATPVGKPPLVSGASENTVSGPTDYPKLVAETWGPLLQPGGKTAGYLSNVAELQQLTHRDHDLYFLNYLPIDTLLHQDWWAAGQEHSGLIVGALELLVSSIAEFAKRFQIERRLAVYVISDHGSTRISRDVVNVLDKQFFKAIALDKHHRFMEVSADHFRNLPQMVEAQCYVLDSERFHTGGHFLVAKRYYRFAETSEDFYVHGGLSPEEVVVPFARFELKPIQIQAPTLRLLEDRFRYAVKSVVPVEIGNPNTFPLEMVSVRLRELDSHATVAQLQPKQLAVAELPLVFKREPGTGNTRDLIVAVQYECQGQPQPPTEQSFSVTMKAMMEVTDDFDL